MLRTYQANAFQLWLVLATIVVFNFLDLMLTIRALDRGAQEANPVMRSLISFHPVTAAVVKLGVVAVVVLIIQRMRRYRRALELSLALLAGFTTLIVYQAAFAVGLAG